MHREKLDNSQKTNCKNEEIPKKTYHFRMIGILPLKLMSVLKRKRATIK